MFKNKGLWLKSTIFRAIKTTIQCFLAGLIASLIYDLPILHILCIAGIACNLSIITSVFGIPEASTDGTLLVDTTDPTTDIYRLNLDGDLNKLPKKKTILLVVDPKANLSQK